MCRKRHKYDSRVFLVQLYVLAWLIRSLLTSVFLLLLYYELFLHVKKHHCVRLLNKNQPPLNLFSFAFSFWILWSSNATQSCRQDFLFYYFFLRNSEVSLIMYIVYLFVLLPLYAFMAALLRNTGNFILKNSHLICLTRDAEATYWLQTKHLKVFLLWKKKFDLIPLTWSSLGPDILMAIMKRTTNYSKQPEI